MRKHKMQFINNLLTYWRKNLSLLATMANHPGPEAARHLPQLCLSVSMMFLLWNAALALLQMYIDPCLIKYFTLVGHKVLVSQMGLWFLLVVGFVLKISHGCHIYLVNQLVKSWTLTLTEASDACSSTDFYLGCILTSWMNSQCNNAVI